MTNEVQVYGMDRQIQVSEDQKRLVKSVVFPGCTDDELKLYLFECDRRGVHPLDRLVFPIKRKEKDGGFRITFQCSVDYLRAEAADTGEYDGQDEPTFGAVDGNGYPESATVAVYKTGISRPTTGTARWKEYYPGEALGFMWRKMPYHMLAKCAEVLALRKAFPKRLAGLYVPEEMQNTDAGEKPPLTPPKKKEAPAAGLESAVILIKEITYKDGTGAKGAWRKFTITDLNGNTYGTFSETMATDAKNAKESGAPCAVTYKVTKYGNDLESLEIAVPEEDAPL